MDRLSLRKRKRRVIYSVAIASAATVVLFFAIPKALHTESGISQPSFAKNERASATGKSVQLRLSGGEAVDLKEDTVEFVIGAQKMKTIGKILTYLPSDNHKTGFATLTVPPGKDYIVKLPDGSEVHLNSVSSIRFPMTFDKNLREIAITGEAYIKAAPGANTPFRIKLPGQTVEVLGTEFNVNCYDSLSHTISLVAGKIRVSTEKDHMELVSGEEVVTAKGMLTKQPFDRYATLSWIDGRYVLNNITLQEVCALIVRVYGVSVQVDNRALLQSRYSGKINKAEPLEQVLRGLASTSGMTYEKDAEGIYHIR